MHWDISNERVWKVALVWKNLSFSRIYFNFRCSAIPSYPCVGNYVFCFPASMKSLIALETTINNSLEERTMTVRRGRGGVRVHSYAFRWFRSIYSKIDNSNLFQYLNSNSGLSRTSGLAEDKNSNLVGAKTTLLFPPPLDTRNLSATSQPRALENKSWSWAQQQHTAAPRTNDKMLETLFAERDFMFFLYLSLVMSLLFWLDIGRECFSLHRRFVQSSNKSFTASSGGGLGLGGFLLDRRFQMKRNLAGISRLSCFIDDWRGRQVGKNWGFPPIQLRRKKCIFDLLFSSFI